MNKSLHFIFIFFVAAAITISCRNTDPTPRQPSETQNIIYSDSSQFTGRLNIYTYNTSAAKLPDAEIFLYLTYQDLLQDLYVLYLKSDRTGFADFGYINYGNYYLRAYATVSGNIVRDTTVVQVRPRRVVSKNIILK